MKAVTWEGEALCDLNCTALCCAEHGEAELGKHSIVGVETAVAKAKAMPLLRGKFHGGSLLRIV
jgi:hypothetical protein